MTVKAKQMILIILILIKPLSEPEEPDITQDFTFTVLYLLRPDVYDRSTLLQHRFCFGTLQYSELQLSAAAALILSGLAATEMRKARLEDAHQMWNSAFPKTTPWSHCSTPPLQPRHHTIVTPPQSPAELYMSTK